MKQCDINDIKLCHVRLKLIALEWYWVTMIFRCKTNPEIHCSPAMQNVQDKTKKLVYTFVKAFGKFTIFSSFMDQFFLITFVCSWNSLRNLLHAYFLQHFWHFGYFSSAILQIWRVEVKNHQSPPSSCLLQKGN